ncbi:hypothetical protein [Streptomyces antimicrobicus]|uniref:Uncharacterized protein n=1 Tax=Streptomyces antimicrobicus TaxID=2883108 RepID=A0ABS8BB71_9ACTN|nr:hypothetical protein [Streptomyces antimicrobicus]MCB5181793.1 hypothetical protein [Streptomyces antimicrobicus]
MHAFSNAEFHAQTHATRSAELAARARAEHLARTAAAARAATRARPARVPRLTAARIRLGEALIQAGTRLSRPRPAAAVAR